MPVDPNVTVTQKQETTEVVNPPGQTNDGVNRLHSIFDNIEKGKMEDKTAEEVIQETATQPEKKVEAKPEPKKEEKVEEHQTDLNKKLDDQQVKKDDKELDAREALRAQTEEKKSEVKDVKTDVKPEEEVPAEEMKVLPTDKPKTAKRIQAFLRQIDRITASEATTKAERDEKAAKLAEAEKKLSEVKTVDPTTETKIKEQLDELSMLRRRYTLDKDPEIQTKYDARVSSAEETIVATLKKRAAGEGLINLIKEEGGWARFAESARQVPIRDADGETKYVSGAELADQILAALPLGDRKSLESAMMEQIQTKRDKERYFKEQQDTAVAYFKKKEEDAAAQQKVAEASHSAGKKLIDEYEAKFLQNDFIKDREIPAKATSAERSAIEEHNKYNSQLRSIFKKSINTGDLNGLLDMVSDSVRYYDERRTSANMRKELEKARSELAAKQAEIDRYKTGGRTVPKAGSIATTPSTDTNREEEKPTSITDAFNRLERGERVGAGAQNED